MKLICAACGGYVHFEVDVEMHQPVRAAQGGICLEPRDADGYTDQAASVRMGVEDMVSYCMHNDIETLEINVNEGGAQNRYITCARCGSSSVTIPFCPWNPPMAYETLEDEVTANRQEFAWLRKERRKHETEMSRLRR